MPRPRFFSPDDALLLVPDESDRSEGNPALADRVRNAGG